MTILKGEKIGLVVVLQNDMTIKRFYIEIKHTQNGFNKKLTRTGVPMCLSHRG
jgi:hypothetical protein